MEFERIRPIEGDKKVEPRQPIRFVSDAERAARMSSEYINPNEIVEPKGLFNGPGGRTFHTEEDANAAFQARASELGRAPQHAGESLAARAVNRAKRVFGKGK